MGLRRSTFVKLLLGGADAKTGTRVILTGLVCAATPALAQQGTTEIGGRVVDAQSAVLPGVNIVITNEDTGAARELVSGPEGSYFASQLVPGRYRLTAKLEGFKALDRRGITLTVGQTTTLDLAMEVGGLAETLTVTGEAALVDITSAEIGGHISSEELNDLPSANRNYMAFIGNAPGTVFIPSGEFLNDSFQANGQPTAANNIVFDGANNTDDQRGSNVGGQTRAANESIAEVQILTNQFDAEWGRASGAVINAVTKSGTNNFSGSAFNFYTSKGDDQQGLLHKGAGAREAGRRQEGVGRHDRWTDRPATSCTSSSASNGSRRAGTSRRASARVPSTARRLAAKSRRGTTCGGSIIKSIRSTPGRSAGCRNGRPSSYRLEAEQETIESYNDETDFDRTMVGTLTSVVSDTKVNTVRVGFVFEDTVHANPAWRALDPEFERCVPCPDGAGLRITEAAPRLDYDTLDIQAATTMDYSSIQRGYSMDNTFSWFIPEKMGRHDLKFGARYSLTTNHNPIWGDMNGSYQFRGTGRHQVRSRQPAVVPGAARHPRARALRVQDEDAHRRVLRAGQVADEARPHAERGRALRHRSLSLRTGPRESAVRGRSRQYPMDTNNIAPRLGLVWNPDGESKSVVRLGYGMFYDRTLAGHRRQLPDGLKYANVVRGELPAGGRGHRPAQRAVPHRSDA